MRRSMVWVWALSVALLSHGGLAQVGNFCGGASNTSYSGNGTGADCNRNNAEREAVRAAENALRASCTASAGTCERVCAHLDADFTGVSCIRNATTTSQRCQQGDDRTCGGRARWQSSATVTGNCGCSCRTRPR